MASEQGLGFASCMPNPERDRFRRDICTSEKSALEAIDGGVEQGCLMQASNVATYIAHGDVALSVLMTTASTLGAIIMTPLLTKTLAGTLVPVDAKASFTVLNQCPANELA